MDKEILYLNNNLVNSLLAQHNKGLVSGISSEEASQNTMSKENEIGGSIGTKAGVDASAGLGKILSHFDANVNGELQAGQSGSTQRRKELSESQRDIINTTFHDYTLELLIKDQESAIMDNIPGTSIGDIIQIKTNSKLFDFELMSELLTISNNNGVTETEEAEDDLKRFTLTHKINKKLVEQIMEYTRMEMDLLPKAKQYYNANKESIDEYITLLTELKTEKRAFQNINILHKYLDNISLLKIDGALCLIEKSYLYEPARIMSFRVKDQKEINIIGRVINITDDDYGEIDSDLSTLPLRMVERLLKMMELVKPGDRIIEPIALYY